MSDTVMDVEGIGDDELDEVRRVLDANSFLGIRAPFANVSESLDDADELAEGIEWDTELWEGCTVGEVVEAIVEGEFMLEREDQWITEFGEPEQAPAGDFMRESDRTEGSD